MDRKERLICLFLLTRSHRDTGLPIKLKSNVGQSLLLAHRRFSKIVSAVPPRSSKKRRVELSRYDFHLVPTGGWSCPCRETLIWGPGEGPPHSPQSHWSSEGHLRTGAAASYRRSASSEWPMGAGRTGRQLMRIGQCGCGREQRGCGREPPALTS